MMRPLPTTMTSDSRAVKMAISTVLVWADSSMAAAVTKFLEAFKLQSDTLFSDERSIAEQVRQPRNCGYI